MSNVANTRPLPPSVLVGDALISMRSISCPRCGTTLRAYDFESIETGFRLVCQGCGLDLQDIDLRRIGG
jgi:hypothetical protein